MTAVAYVPDGGGYVQAEDVILAELPIARDPSGLPLPLRLGRAPWARCHIGCVVLIVTDDGDVHRAELEHDPGDEQAVIRWIAAPSRHAKRARVRLPRSL